MDKPDFLSFYTDTPKFVHPPGLSLMRALTRRLGDPQDALRCVHIAGTNGKGSAAAMTAAILRAAGRRTGLYTSPDLTGLWERIQVDGVAIPLDTLERITARVRRASEGLAPLSYFEKLTAAAFLYFAEAGCDAVALETGLGGRCDAANVIKKPLCSVIMPIGLDHTAQLGGTLAAIAGEKAGILKPGCPAVSAPQPPEALEVLRRAAEAVGADLRLVDITTLRILSRSAGGQAFSYGGERFSLSLLGDHQAENAACAIETARVLGLPEAAIREGLKAAVWPCRFELIPGAPPFVLDGAHNPHGAAALAAGLRAYFPGRSFTMLMGVMADKDADGILRELAPLAARFICIAPDGSSRALPPEALAARIAGVPARTADSLPEALRLARSFGEPVCAFGSLYYIGEARKLLLQEV